ncbi:MAG TPA: peptidoglycan-binding domain-containing protein [Solimonas sp.]|nr:peptidoglycan-binding domain-containing protein [Solimonas sp.]
MRSSIVSAIALSLLLVAAPVLAKPLQYVRDAQRLLAALGYEAGELDGEFDFEFEAALNHFKGDEHLPPDGRLDAATREALNKAFANRASRPPPSPRVVAAAPPVVMAAPAPGAAPQPVYPSEATMPVPAQTTYAYPDQPVPAAPSMPAAPSTAAPAPPPAPTAASAPMITPRRVQDPFLGFVVEAAFEFGGDKVATVSFDDFSTQDVRAGQGVTLSIGGLYRSARNEGFTLRGTGGYKFVVTKADNADIKLDRVVAELVAGWLFPHGLWVGAGPVYHGNIKFDSGGFGADLDFEDAVGGTAEIGWRWIALSYTGIDYKDEFGGKYDAGNAGLMFSYAFGS